LTLAIDALPGDNKAKSGKKGEGKCKALYISKTKNGPAETVPLPEPPVPLKDPDKHEIPPSLGSIFAANQQFESLQQVGSELPRPGARPAPGMGFHPSGEFVFRYRRGSFLTL
jgi:hypothetical protein